MAVSHTPLPLFLRTYVLTNYTHIMLMRSYLFYICLGMYEEFVRDYIERTNMNEKSNFVDLGCGVNSFALQVRY